MKVFGSSGEPLSSIIEPIQQWAEESETAQAAQSLPIAAWLLIPMGLGYWLVRSW